VRSVASVYGEAYRFSKQQKAAKANEPKPGKKEPAE
jgi:hypothetical protein